MLDIFQDISASAFNPQSIMKWGILVKPDTGEHETAMLLRVWQSWRLVQQPLLDFRFSFIIGWTHKPQSTAPKPSSLSPGPCRKTPSFCPYTQHQILNSGLWPKTCGWTRPLGGSARHWGLRKSALEYSSMCYKNSPHLFLEGLIGDFEGDFHSVWGVCVCVSKVYFFS